jgi:protein-tyrosine-phosphatase
MPFILFICTANQCRSPTAQVLFERKLAKEGLDGNWQVASAGTLAVPGIPATAYAQAVVHEVGLDLTDHRSRPLDADLLAASDLVLVMERGHKEALQFEFPEAAGRVYLLSEMAGADFSVDDPIGKSIEEYRAMRAELEDLIERGFQRIRELVGE